MTSCAATKAHQTTTLTQAKNWGATWTSADLEFLAACADIPAAEVALALGRSLYAINVAREGLSDRLESANTRTAAARPTRVKGGQRWLADPALYEL